MASFTSGLPFYLQPGQVLIYGVGTATGINNINPNNPNLVFGYVNMVWNYGNINASIGDSVMFNKNEAICVLTYNNWPYTLVEEARLVITEIPGAP